ncbi:hypothetical protein [Lactiplantibacillus plantarum]|uniref:hypothetical protein n=1 Tax=Lactiplantibacillus plantarum TaxID=1590 RepID=UPI0025B53E2D|nr:hypothetical protein [Lactiplantibacillus plantarum]MDN3985715.1 hypothetical protein [Lactiplantibacillus plantarum]
MKYDGYSHNDLLQILKKGDPNAALLVFFNTVHMTPIDKKLYEKLAMYKNKIFIRLDDIETFTPPATCPSRTHAKKIIDFIDDHRNEYIIVSCNAGESRTGAVIHYLDQLSKKNLEKWKIIPDQFGKEPYYVRDQFRPNRLLDRMLSASLK